MKNYNSVKECLDDGHSWEQCVGVNVSSDGKISASIKKSCPIPMKKALKESLFSNGEVEWKEEKDNEQTKK